MGQAYNWDQVTVNLLFVGVGVCSLAASLAIKYAENPARLTPLQPEMRALRGISGTIRGISRNDPVDRYLSRCCSDHALIVVSVLMGMVGSFLLVDSL